jgi:ATP-dependent DNA helicase RecG
MSFMMQHLPIAGRFEPGRVERIDEPLFPVAALREAVISPTGSAKSCR